MTRKLVNRKTKEKSSLRFEGIYENGYGLISKSFMKDRRITPEGKCIYTYLCSYCGGGTTAYPSVALQCADLGMSENRYYKHRKLLVEYGYIKVDRQTEIVEYDDGTTRELFTNNIYTIVLNVDDELKNKKASRNKIIKKRTVKKVDTKKSENPKVVDITISSPYLQNEGTDFEGMENEGNNNNSLNNNNINISSSSSNDKYNNIIDKPKSHEEEDTLKKDLKTLMAFCNENNFKLTTVQAKVFLRSYGLDKVMQGITMSINGSKEAYKKLWKIFSHNP